MTVTLTIRLPKSLARDFRAKTRAAKTNPSAVLRRAAAEFAKRKDALARNAMQEHIRARAGRGTAIALARNCSGRPGHKKGSSFVVCGSGPYIAVISRLNV